MIIVNVKDYYEIHESLEVLNEANVWNWIKNRLRRILGNYEGKLTDLVAPSIVDSAINSKSGQFDPKVLDVKKIADTDVSLDEIFKSIGSKIPKGKYIRTGLEYLKEFSEKADAQFAASVAKKVMDTDAEEDAERNISATSGKALEERSKEYSEAFKKKYNHLNSIIEKEIEDFISKANEKNDPKFAKAVSIRYNNAKAVLLLLEYEIKKKRWKLEDVGNLTKEMADAYKKAITMEKDLAADIGEKREEIKSESVDKFKKVATENYSIGDVATLKTKKGGSKKAEIKDFGETEITLLPAAATKTVNITYEEFNRWLIRESEKSGI